MAKHSKPQTGECVYCGRLAPLEDDHIPPKNLFTGRAGLITVPSCKCCNQGACKDDEYFRLAIGFHADVANHPEAGPIVAKIKRSLFRPEASGFMQDFLARTTVSEKKTPAGIYFLRTTTDVDEERVGRVAERITKGLFWHHRGQRLPDGYVVHTASREAIRHTSGPRGAMMVRSVKELAGEPPYGVRNGQVFHYRFKFWDSDDPNVSAWVLVFFRRFIFLTAIAPQKV